MPRPTKEAVVLLEALVALTSLSSVSSFALSSLSRPFAIRSNNGSGQTTTTTTTTTTTSRRAIVYGWDGMEEEECAVEDYPDFLSGADMLSNCLTAHHPTVQALTDALSTCPDRIGSLARLAVAFSPPDRRMNLKDIEKVEVLCVTETHLEIQAVVPQDHGLAVTLLVPVNFPKSCGIDDGLHGCVYDNLELLDCEAEAKIKELKLDGSADDDDYGADGGDYLERLCSLEDGCELSHPSWWVSPNTDAALMAECELLRSTLNGEDFRSDVRGLARRGLEVFDDGDTYDVLRAAVLDVGPAGLFLKAAVRREGQENLMAVEVPLPFGETAGDAAGLRATVLGAVAQSQVV